MQMKHFEETQISQQQALENAEQALEITEKIMAFLILGLVTGGFLRQISKKTGIPYTPMVLVFGTILGYYNENLGYLGQASLLISKIHPEIILLVFIPILIFESAYNCDWHVFRKSLWSIITLAGPGVLYGTLLTGVVFKLVLQYPDSQMTWYQAMVLGCVLSATDPVAVVALLKQLGASARFNTLVEGESLLNDGTSMVFLAVFLNLAQGKSQTVSEVAIDFTRTALGGPVLAIIFGLFISYWLKRIFHDPILSMNYTFAGAYLCFYLAEFSVIKVSGVLSVVVLGLYMSSIGRHQIGPESHEHIHSIWSYIQYIGETLIFIITGIIVGEKIIQSSTVTSLDWIRMLGFWFLMILVRAIMIITFYPILSTTGYGLKKRQMIVLIYGGLRGALGLCLSLIVNSKQGLSERFRELTIFYMCGMAMLTIIINGLTCGKLVNRVQMIIYPQTKKKLYEKCAKNVISSTKQKLKRLKNDPSVVYADWKDVQQIAEIDSIVEGSEVKAFESESINLRNMAEQKQILAEIRFRFGRNLKKKFWQAYHKNEITQSSVHILSESCDIINDESSEKFHFFTILTTNFFTDFTLFLMNFQNWFLVGGYISTYAVRRIFSAYEMSSAFIYAAEQTIKEFQHSFPLKSSEMKIVIQEVRANIEEAIRYNTNLQQQFPTVIKPVHTLKAAVALLKHKQNKVEEMFNEGYIDQGQFHQFQINIDKKIISAQHRNFQLQEVNFYQILAQCIVFSDLPTHQMANIQTKSQQRIFGKGTIVAQKGQLYEKAYFIVSGSVQEQFDDDDFYFIRGAGSFINPHDFTYEEVSRAYVKAITDCKIIQIPLEIIFQLINKYENFRKKWFKKIFPYSLNFTPTSQIFEKSFTSRQLVQFMQKSEVVTMIKGTNFKFVNGGYVFQGELTKNYPSKKQISMMKIENDQDNYSRQQFIEPGVELFSISNSIVMKFTFNILKYHKDAIISDQAQSDDSF